MSVDPERVRRAAQASTAVAEKYHVNGHETFVWDALEASGYPDALDRARVENENLRAELARARSAPFIAAKRTGEEQ